MTSIILLHLYHHLLRCKKQKEEENLKKKAVNRIILKEENKNLMFNIFKITDMSAIEQKQLRLSINNSNTQVNDSLNDYCQT